MKTRKKTRERARTRAAQPASEKKGGRGGERELFRGNWRNRKTGDDHSPSASSMMPTSCRASGQDDVALSAAAVPRAAALSARTIAASASSRASFLATLLRVSGACRRTPFFSLFAPRSASALHVTRTLSKAAPCGRSSTRLTGTAVHWRSAAAAPAARPLARSTAPLTRVMRQRSASRSIAATCFCVVSVSYRRSTRHT